VLVLPVEGEQSPAQQFQLRRRSRPSGDEGACSPAHRHPSAEHHLSGALRQPLGDLCHLRLVEQAIRQVEDALHPGLLGIRTDDLLPRLAAHQQVQRVSEDGLAGAGLACYRVEAFAEAQFCLLDQQQVLDSQLS